MSTREERLIADALHFAHLTQMPQPAKDNTIWIEGIAKIRLANNSIAYGVVKRNADLSYRVTYINGDTYAIVKIEEVYPYNVLDKDFIKKFRKTDTEKDRITYLRSLHLPYLENVDLDGMTMDDLNKEVVKAAVYQQLKSLEE